jgi:hypothetical protein
MFRGWGAASSVLFDPKYSSTCSSEIDKTGDILHAGEDEKHA